MQRDGYEGYLLLDRHDERAFLQRQVQLRRIFGSDTAFGKHHHAAARGQGFQGFIERISPAVALLAVDLNVQLGKHIAEQGYLLHAMLSHKGKIIVENNAHRGNVQIRKVIGTKHVGTPPRGPETVGHLETNADQRKKQFAPEPVNKMGVGLPCFFLQKKVGKRKQQQKQRNEPENAPGGIK